MLDIFKSFFETLSRIGKYYGVEKSDSESEMAALSYTEKKRVLSNLRRTLIFTVFLILYLLLIIVVAPLRFFPVNVSTLMLILAAVVMLAAFVGLGIMLYNKGNTKDFHIDKRLKRRIQVTYSLFWTIYYAMIIAVLYSFEDWVLGMAVWMPIMIVGFLVPVYSLQEGFLPMLLAAFSVFCFFKFSNYDFLQLSATIPAIIIVIAVTDINHVERINGFYQEARIYGESSASRRRLGNVFEEVYDMAFELDFARNECQILRNNEAYSLKFESEVVGLDNFRASILEIVHPDDAHTATKVLDEEYLDNEFIIEGRHQVYIEVRVLDNHDEYVWISVLISREKLMDGTYGDGDLLLCLVQNIEERKKSENKLKLEAERDPLTQLYNKMTTRSLIEECFEKNSAAQHALIIIDIDNFKTINDTRGHTVGDQILLAFANELSRNFRESDILGRAGGDEFVVLIKNIQSIALVCDKLQQLTSAFKKYGIDNGFPGRLSTSIGVAIFGKDGSSYDELFKRADAALYEAKRNGKDQYKFSITRS